MSVEIQAAIICDGCGRRVEGQIQTTSSEGMRSYFSAKRQVKERRWMINLRYGKAKHFCNCCADSVPNAATETVVKEGK